MGAARAESPPKVDVRFSVRAALERELGGAVVLERSWADELERWFRPASMRWGFGAVLALALLASTFLVSNHSQYGNDSDDPYLVLAQGLTQEVFHE